MTRPTVSLCMIVRNEEQNLAQGLKGLAGLASEIIVVDTGSTDDTRNVAAGLGARVFEFPWIDDFSAARNESSRHANGDYIFWLDADDRIDEANFKRLASLFESLATADPGRESTFVMACAGRTAGNRNDVAASHTRLFPNRPDFRWVGRVHERIDFGQRLLKYVDTDIVIRHTGYGDAVQYAQKRFRNSRILEQEYVANPDDVWNLFYLGRVRHWQGDMREALRFLQRSILLDPHNHSATTPIAFLLAANSLRKMRRNEEAMRILEAGLARFGYFAPLMFDKAGLLREQRRFSEAEQIYRQLLSLPPHQAKQGGMWVDLQRERWRLMLGHVLHEQGRFSEAKAEYRLVLNEYPNFVEAWFALGQLDIELGKPREVEPITRELEKCPDGAFDSAMLRAQICVLDGRYDEARHWIGRAIAMRPNDVGAHTVRSVLLYREGLDWEQCREAHETVLSLDPNHADARVRLEHVREMLARRRNDSTRDFEITPGVHSGNISLSDLGAACRLSFSC